MSEKKYAVFPQHIISKSDGDRHFVSAQQLIRLFDVNPKECEIWNTDDIVRGFRPHPDLIWLTPMYNGDYSIETARKRMGK